MDKVKLPKEVAIAVESIRNRIGEERTLFNYPNIANHATKNKEYNVINIYINQSEDNFKNYYNALLNGYEVDKEPEEKVLERYEHYRNEGLHVSANAFEECVKLLGVDIKGVTS